MINVPTDCLPAYKGKAKYFIIEPTTAEAFGVFSGGRVIRVHPQTRRQLIAVLQIRAATRQLIQAGA